MKYWLFILSITYLSCRAYAGEPLWEKAPPAFFEEKAVISLSSYVHHGYDSIPGKIDLGNNRSFTPFKNFAAPVAVPTPMPGPDAAGGIANLEKDIETKPAEAARAGIHLPPGSEGAKTVRYDLYVGDTLVKYTGKQRKAIAINGSIAAPTLVFTLGDTAVIYVHNRGEAPTAIHWHGVLLPNRMDGVPYLTQQPIAPGTTYVYKFVVTQSGAYWYHSHFALQEQSGLYGALIFNKRTEPDIPTIPVVLSDWSDLRPREIDRSLHAGSDWFAIQKKSVQSYSEAIRAGHLATKLTNEWKRMKSMDVSDVYYERVFANGAVSSSFGQFSAGDRVRLRIANGSASTYFWLNWSGGKITVTANDGHDVEPVEVDRLIIGVAETYDILVKVPDNKQYELLATSEDRIRHASIWLGSGIQAPARQLPRLDYFEGMKMMNGMMRMSGDMNPMGMKMSLQKMDMNSVMYPEEKMSAMEHEHGVSHGSGSEEADIYSCSMHPEVKSDQPGKCPKCGMDLEKKKDMGTMDGDGKSAVTLNYNMLKSTEKTSFADGPWRELKFELTGNMNRYVWTLNNKTVSEADKVLVKKGERIRLIVYNNSMMRHPMHLHGHDFRTLNKFGDYSPLKNTLDIMPMETDTLEMDATESGDWFFHCHILYHMMAGMGRILSYQDSAPNPEIPHPAHAYRMLRMDDRMIRLMGEASWESNGFDGRLTVSQTRWTATTLWRLGYRDSHGYESETMVGRYLGRMQWWLPYIGFDYHYKKEGGPRNLFGHEEQNWFGQRSNKLKRRTGVAGIAYTLPGLTIADARIDANGRFRLQLSRESIPLTPRLRFSWMVNTDKEYMAGFRYVATKYFNLSAHYDSDMGPGAGITFTY